MADLFHVRTDEEVTVIGCHGEIVFGGDAADLAACARSLMGKGRRIVLDLSDVARLDSFGIGVLFGIYTSSLTAGATLALSGVSPWMKEMLTQVSLISMLAVYSTDAEAVRALAKKPVAEHYH